MHAIPRPWLGNGLLDQPTVSVFLAVGLVSMIIVIPLAAELGRHSSAAQTASAAESAKVTARTQPAGEATP
jgi:hypothetical protein